VHTIVQPHFDQIKQKCSNNDTHASETKHHTRHTNVFVLSHIHTWAACLSSRRFSVLALAPSVFCASFMICFVPWLSALDSFAQALALAMFRLKSSLSRFLKSFQMRSTHAWDTKRERAKEKKETNRPAKQTLSSQCNHGLQSQAAVCCASVVLPKYYLRIRAPPLAGAYMPLSTIASTHPPTPSLLPAPAFA